MLKLNDVVIHNHRESKEREFFLTIKVKEEDIDLTQKEFLREACRTGLAFEVEIKPDISSKPPQYYSTNSETGEVTIVPTENLN